jgi:hypothetical protein
MTRRILSTFVVSAAFMSAPLHVSAQSLFSTRGLGSPIAPIDARSAALGGIGTGLGGFNLSLDNPADASGLLRRGATATMSPSWSSIDLGNNSDHLGGSRFPLIRVFYPATPRLVASLAYGAYLDQTWGVRFDGREVLSNDTVTTTDVLSSTGGVAQLRFGFAYALSDKVSLGLGGGILSGSVDRAVSRAFQDSTFDAFESRLTWSFKAPLVSAGFRIDPVANTRLAASIMLAGKLKARAEDSIAQDRTYGSAMRMTVGASTRIAPKLMLTAGAARDKYPDITADPVVTPTGTTSGASTRDTWKYGAGLEYTGKSTATRTFPLRLGVRYEQLPYAGANETAPKEFSIALGTGFDLTTDTGLPQTMFDITLEHAKRTGLVGPVASDGLTENLWRMNFTLSIFGR